MASSSSSSSSSSLSSSLSLSIQSKYRKGKFLGEGQWGSVFEASTLEDTPYVPKDTKVAIKRIEPIPVTSTNQRRLPPGLNFTGLREIKYMRQLQGSPYIVNLIDVFVSEGKHVMHLVLEYCSYDLTKIIYDRSILLKPGQIKTYALMLMQGMEWCHQHFILHRDLKPANLMIGHDGNLKIADFGLARSFSSPEQLSSEVVTRWYRCPELLFGATAYGAAIDMWAVGCIIAEMVIRCPLLRCSEDSDVSQLAKIFNILGTPITTAEEDSADKDKTSTEFTTISQMERGRVWMDAQLLPNYVSFEAIGPLDLSKLIGGSKKSSSTNELLSLVLKCLIYNPSNRITAKEALAHPYFTSAPAACAIDALPTPSSFEAEEEKEQAKKRMKV